MACMTSPQAIFSVGVSGSAPVAPETRLRLFELAAAIRKHLGQNLSACCYALRFHATYGASYFLLDLSGSSDVLSVVMVPGAGTRLLFPSELEVKLAMRTIILPVADFIDAFYLLLFLFDNLGLKPSVALEGSILPAKIRHGLGVFSER
jgi:hypothetical protein